MCVSIMPVPPGKCSGGDRLERGRWRLSGTTLEFTHLMGGVWKVTYEDEEEEEKRIEKIPIYCIAMH